MIGLIDGNNFFVSCERVFDPSLEGKAIAVLSNNDGCCISRSNEFKALNIPMGTPFFQIQHLAANGKIIVKSSNYELYGDLSRRLIEVLREFAPQVEQYSIDEAFIYPEHIKNINYLALGYKIRQTLLQWLGLPCGVGFAPTKTLAKIANHIAKKSPSGIFVMPENPNHILDKTPIEEVWGIGRALSEKLKKLGILTAGQFIQHDPVKIRKQFSVVTAKTLLELRGQKCFTIENPNAPSQSISCSRTFGTPITLLEELSESIATYTAIAATKLRRQKLFAMGVNIYTEISPEYHPIPLASAFQSATVIFPHPTDDTSVMLNAIRPKLEKLFINNRRYRKSGVLFFGLESSNTTQLELFENNEKLESSKLFNLVDQINTLYGRNTIFTLAEGTKKKWQMKRELLTPNYTTNWKELLNVK